MDANKKDIKFSEEQLKGTFLEVMRIQSVISDEDFLNFLYEIFIFYLYNASELEKTYKIVSNFNGPAPVFLYNSTNNEIKYFPNLPKTQSTKILLYDAIDTMVTMQARNNATLIDYIRYFCRKLFDDTQLLYNQYNKERTEGKWEPSKVKRTLYVYRISSPRRYFQKAGYTCATLDKLCATFSSTTCFITNDVDTMIQVYEAGASSCMVSTSGSAQYWKSTYKENGFHPIRFYGHIPDVGMVYMLTGTAINKDTVRARVVVNTKLKLYYHVYYSEGPYYSDLITWLKAKGFKRDSNFLIKALPQEIKIKGMWSTSNKDYIGPRPYVDGENFYYKTQFLVKTKTFKYTLGTGEGTGFKKQKGFDAAKQVLGKPFCSSCEKKLEHRVYTYKKFMFCSPECVNIFSLHIKNTADNIEEVSVTKGIVDPLSHKKFTSLYSARKYVKYTIGLQTVKLVPPVYIAETLKDIFNAPKDSAETYTWQQYLSSLYLCGGVLRAIQNSTLISYMEKYNPYNGAIRVSSDVYNNKCSSNIRNLIANVGISVIYVDLDKIPKRPKISEQAANITW